MTIAHAHFEQLKQIRPGAVLKPLPSGAYLVVVPDIDLPEGWAPRKTTVRLILPVGYPLSRPDCFWTDQNLRLIGGTLPQNTNTVQPIPEVNEPALWFSWHTERWNPNRDNLLTWFYVILERLKRAQ